MESNVTFEDNRLEVKEALDNQAIKFLYEAKDSLVSQTQRNTPVVSGKTRQSFGNDSFVDDDAFIAYIGSALEEALWLERGTGEHAIGGKGRKGGWYVCADQLDPRTIGLFNYKYKFPIIYGKNGKVFYYIKGMEARQMLYKAYQTKKSKIIKRATEIYEELSKS